jgi:hypothetical protein
MLWKVRHTTRTYQSFLVRAVDHHHGATPWCIALRHDLAIHSARRHVPRRRLGQPRRARLIATAARLGSAFDVFGLALLPTHVLGPEVLDPLRVGPELLNVAHPSRARPAAR